MPDTDGKHPNLQHYTPESSETHHNSNYVDKSKGSYERHQAEVKDSVDRKMAATGIAPTKDQRAMAYKKAGL